MITTQRLEALRNIYAENESMGAGDVRDLIAEIDRLRVFEVERDPAAHATIAELREAREVARVLALQADYDAELSKSAALTRAMMTVAAELREDQARCPGCNIVKPDWATRLEAARAATYGPEPKRSSEWDGVKFPSEPKQPEPERCNATYQGYVECDRFAGHANIEHVSADGCRWQDGWLGAKPHAPAREEPEVHSMEWWRNRAGSSESEWARCEQDIKRLTKERDLHMRDRDSWQRCAEEHKAEIQKTNEYFEARLADLTKALATTTANFNEAIKLRDEALLEAALWKDTAKRGPIWGKGVASELADRGILNLTRELDQLRAAITELEKIRQRTILLDLKGDAPAELAELQRRRAHLLELCGVK